MGCGASTESQDVGGSENKSNVNNNQNAQNGHIPNGEVKNSPKKGRKDNESNNNAKNEGRMPAPVPKGVAFEVELENKDTYNSLIHKHPPKRLQHLAPLDDAPRLTAEQLQEKIRLAEEKRHQELERKKEKTRKNSRLRQHLLEAKKIEQQTHDKEQKELDEKQRSAGKNREAKLREIEEKKRVREERAQRARQKAARLKVEHGEDIDFEVEKDEGYNADDTDSWLEGESNIAPLQSEPSGLSERIYSGRESPHKTIHVRSSAENRARMSAFSTSTADSFDYAFQRKPPIAPVNTTAKDDFFDS